MDDLSYMESPEKKPCFSEKGETGQAFAHPAWRWVSERGLLVATGETTLARHEAAAVSYPGFWDDLARLGG